MFTSTRAQSVIYTFQRQINTPGLPITSGTLSVVGLPVEVKDDRTFSHCFHMISFCSRVYLYVHGMRYLHHEVHELDGYQS